jgi:hypothetical protein
MNYDVAFHDSMFLADFVTVLRRKQWTVVFELFQKRFHHYSRVESQLSFSTHSKNQSKIINAVEARNRP